MQGTAANSDFRQHTSGAPHLPFSLGERSKNLTEHGTPCPTTMSSPALLPRWRALQLLRHAGPRTLHANLIGRGNRSFASGGPRQSSSFGLRDTSKTTTSTTGSTEETLTVDENVGGSEAEESTEWTESFGDVAGELMRRRRKTEAKRLQRVRIPRISIDRGLTEMCSGWLPRSSDS